MKNLKDIIKENLSDTDIKINLRYTKIYSKTCFWVKENFSAIIKHHSRKYYCYFDRSLNDIVIETM